MFDLKALLEPIYELQYNFGDPRLHFMKYLLSLKNTETYFEKDPEKSIINDFFVYRCNSSNKGQLFLPKGDLKKILEANLMFGEKPFLVLPILIRNKKSCKYRNDARHMMYILYNRITNEIERIDLKKYHLKGFKIKLIYKKIKKTIPGFIDSVIENETDFLPEHDVNVQFMDKLKSDNEKLCYPLFLISYLKLRTSYPQKTYDEIYERVLKLSPKQIFENWKEYIEFYKKTAVYKKCKAEKVRNLETGKCINIERNKDMLIEKPVKVCKKGLYYNMFTNRCVKKDKLIDINISLEEAMGMKINRDDKIQHLGNDLTIIPATNFVISKHNNAFLVYPKYRSAIKVKTRYSFMWTWSDEKQDFEFSVPKDYWEIFKEGMESPYRFIITLASLVSKRDEGGHISRHANVLIYDKNTNELERFDGLGAHLVDRFNVESMDEKIKQIYNEKEGILFPTGYKYYSPMDYCPKNISVFQMKETEDLGSDDLKGNCAVWRLWYIDTRIGNPQLTRDEVVKYAMKKLDNVNSISKFIKSYQAYINSNIKKLSPLDKRPSDKRPSDKRPSDKRPSAKSPSDKNPVTKRKEPKPCPEGKKRNPKTGRCIKI